MTTEIIKITPYNSIDRVLIIYYCKILHPGKLSLRSWEVWKKELWACVIGPLSVNCCHAIFSIKHSWMFYRKYSNDTPTLCASCITAGKNKHVVAWLRFYHAAGTWTYSFLSKNACCCWHFIAVLLILPGKVCGRLCQWQLPQFSFSGSQFL